MAPEEKIQLFKDFNTVIGQYERVLFAERIQDYTDLINPEKKLTEKEKETIEKIDDYLKELRNKK